MTNTGGLTSDDNSAFTGSGLNRFPSGAAASSEAAAIGSAFDTGGGGGGDAAALSPDFL